MVDVYFCFTLNEVHIEKVFVTIHPGVVAKVIIHTMFSLVLNVAKKLF